MAANESDPSLPPVRFPAWEREYQKVLAETNTLALWKCVEIAEAKMLLRRDFVEKSPHLEDERQALAEALSNLDKIKRERLGFG